MGSKDFSPLLTQMMTSGSCWCCNIILTISLVDRTLRRGRQRFRSILCELSPESVSQSREVYRERLYNELQTSAPRTTSDRALTTPPLRADRRIYGHYPGLNIDPVIILRLQHHHICVCGRALTELWPHSTPNTDCWNYGGECQNLQGRSLMCSREANTESRSSGAHLRFSPTRWDRDGLWVSAGTVIAHKVENILYIF